MQNRAPWNGRQFTAEDAAWNLERIGGLYAERTKIPLSSFQRASMVGNITKAVAVDPLTVRSRCPSRTRRSSTACGTRE
ncbi:MAG: hypothetical protein WCL53_04280 [Chloroflexota bacterium]